MKIFSPLEKLIAAHTVLFGLIVLGLLPEEEPSNGTSAIGWGTYFFILAIAFVFVIRSWIDYADYKRKQFQWNQILNEWSAVVYDWKKDEGAKWDFLTDEEFSREFNKRYGEIYLNKDGNPEWNWESEENPFRDDNEPNQEGNR